MPDVILAEIAAALAAKASGSLYDLVKNKFKGRKPALDALAAASSAAADSPQVVALAKELEMAEAYDGEFSSQLRAAWTAISGHASRGGVTNNLTGSVKGNVVQARDIHGNITF